MIPGSLNTMMLGGRPEPDFLELVATQTQDVSDISNNFTVNLPAHQAGDVIVVVCGANDDTEFTLREGASPGWVLTSANYPSTGVTVTLGVATIVATSDSMALPMRSGEDARAIVSAVFRSKTGRIPKIERGGMNVISGTPHTIAEFTPSGGVKKYTYLHAYAGGYNAGQLTAPGFTALVSRGSDIQPRVRLSAKQSENTSEGPFSIDVSSGRRISMLLAAWEE